MVHLAECKLVLAVRPGLFDPISTKRMKFIARVTEQLEYAACAKSGDVYCKTTSRYETDLQTDEKHLVQIQRRVNPWWWMDKDAKYFMTVKYGTRIIEFAKGKPAVQAETLDQIIEVLKSLKTATANGELDALLAQAGEHIRKRFKPMAKPRQ